MFVFNTRGKRLLSRTGVIAVTRYIGTMAKRTNDMKDAGDMNVTTLVIKHFPPTTNHVKRTHTTNTYEPKSKDKKFTICVEGNIASGKTTFLQYFQGFKNVEVFEEPVKKWRDVQGHNLLAAFYENPDRLSLTLQTYVQLTMLDQHTKTSVMPIKLMERSIFSAKYCFVENLKQIGRMNDLEYIVLTEWFDWIRLNNDLNIDLIIYLQTKPETVHQRIQKRCRQEETSIPLEYLQSLHQLHEEWLIHEKFPLPAPVLTLNADKDLDEMLKVYEEKSSEILCGQV